MAYFVKRLVPFSCNFVSARCISLLRSPNATTLLMKQDRLINDSYKALKNPIAFKAFSTTTDETKTPEVDTKLGFSQDSESEVIAAKEEAPVVDTKLGFSQDNTEEEKVLKEEEEEESESSGSDSDDD